MGQRTHTKDEKLMLSLYETALQSGDLKTHFNRYEIGKKIGMHPKGTNTICVLLLQSNFIKKGDGDDIYLTPNGEELVKRLLRE